MPRTLLQRIAGRIARLTADPEARFLGYTGNHGCLRVGASHIAWNQVEGDYLEFGVWRGESFVEAYQAITWNRDIVHGASPGSHADPVYQRWQRTPPRFFAFDSFAGLPPGEAERQSDYHAGAYACSEPEFRANITRGGVPADRVITVPGFYDQSLTAELRQKHRLTRAALVMIDCDLYESTVPVLDFLTPLVAQGTILIFHDWYRFKGSRDQGEQRACREWLERTPGVELEAWWQEGAQAKAFLVHDRRGG